MLLVRYAHFFTTMLMVEVTIMTTMIACIALARQAGQRQGNTQEHTLVS